MSTTNGNLIGNESKASTAAIATAMLASLTTATPKRPTEAVAEMSLAQVLGSLETYIDAKPELQRAVEEKMAQTIRQALSFTGESVPATDDIVKMLRTKTIGTKSKGGTVARAFWWGFHIEVSHEDLVAFLGGANVVNSIAAAVGAVPTPASPFILLAAGFVAAALGLCAGLDRGRGVYISMLWLVPGVFVPTSVV